MTFAIDKGGFLEEIICCQKKKIKKKKKGGGGVKNWSLDDENEYGKKAKECDNKNEKDG